MASGARKELGMLGETLAAEFLNRKGYQVITRNLVLKAGEIDILAKDGEVVVIVEVKTQKSATFSDPIYKIDRAKQRKLRLLGEFIAVKYPEQNIRFDCVTVHWKKDTSEPTITHLENSLE